LEAASGVDLALVQNGTLRVATNSVDVSLLTARVEHHRRQGVSVEWVNDRPEFLNANVVAVAHYADEAQIENRNLGPALAKAFVNASGVLHAGEPIVRVLIANEKLLGVESEHQRYACDVVVIAAGAWSGRIDGLPPMARPPIIPRKGQILSLSSGSASRPFGPLVGVPGAYAVPRKDGRVVIGATLEDTGFETQIDRASVNGLAAKLRDVLKGSENWPIAEVWSGLRPGTPDNLPILGDTCVDGFYLATGQFRDGILLTPWIADMISSQIMSGRAPDGLSPFSIARFQGGTSK
jgi:glycine oxidase